MAAVLQSRTPGPALAPFVSAIHDYAAGPMPLVVQPASLDVPVIVCLSGGWRVAFDRAPEGSDRVRSFVSGLHAGTVAIASESGAACVQVNFTPLGARLALRQPMDAFAGASRRPRRPAARPPARPSVRLPHGRRTARRGGGLGM